MAVDSERVGDFSRAERSTAQAVGGALDGWLRDHETAGPLESRRSEGPSRTTWFVSRRVTGFDGEAVFSTWTHNEWSWDDAQEEGVCSLSTVGAVPTSGASTSGTATAIASRTRDVPSDVALRALSLGFVM